jgi:hypothetical protein
MFYKIRYKKSTRHFQLSIEMRGAKIHNVGKMAAFTATIHFD